MQSMISRAGTACGLCPSAWGFIRPALRAGPLMRHPHPSAPAASSPLAARYSSLRPRAAARGGPSETSAAPPGPVVFFATCHPGLEQVVAGELRDLGYLGVEPSKAGVSFRGRCVADGYAANMWLRSAIRVLVLLAEGRLGTDRRDGGCRGGDALYDMVYDAVPWSDVIPAGRNFSVEPRLWSCTDISSTRLVWSRVKDAVCDSIRRHRPFRPEPPARGEVADVPLHVSCYQDTVKIFRDMSGQSLHRRGYRDVMHRAALNEAAAAGVLELSGWREAVEAAGDGEGLVLADPMCGSGTLLIEAALMARDIAPGLMRSLDLDHDSSASASAGGRDMRRDHPGSGGRGGGGRGTSSRGGSGRGSRLDAPVVPDAWPFQRWEDFDRAAWDDVVDGARERVRPKWKGRLLGVDVHEGALSLAVRQAKKAGVYGMLELTHGDCGSVVPAATPQLVVCNPPWGLRLTRGRGDRAAEGLGGDDGGYYNGSSGGDSGGDGGYREEEPPRGTLAGGVGRRGGAEEGSGASSSSSSPSSWERAAEGGGDEAFLEGAWRSLDGFLYRHCPGATATVVSGSPAPFRHLRLRTSAKHRLVLSGVDVQINTYKIRDAASRTATASTPQPQETEPTDASPAGAPTTKEHVASRSRPDRKGQPGGGVGEGSVPSGVPAGTKRNVGAVAPVDSGAYDDYFVRD